MDKYTVVLVIFHLMICLVSEIILLMLYAGVDSLTLKGDTEQIYFCVMCFFIIFLKNYSQYGNTVEYRHK